MLQRDEAPRPKSSGKQTNQVISGISSMLLSREYKTIIHLFRTGSGFIWERGAGGEMGQAFLSAVSSSLQPPSLCVHVCEALMCTYVLHYTCCSHINIAYVFGLVRLNVIDCASHNAGNTLYYIIERKTSKFVSSRPTTVVSSPSSPRKHISATN